MLGLVKQTGRRGIVLVAAVTAWALLGAIGSDQALAAPPFPVGYELQLSPYARVLDAVGTPQFMDVLWEESCDNPHLRVRARNKPALMLTNDLASQGAITTFSLTINEGPYLFGTGDFVTDAFDDFIKNTIYTDAGVTITSSTVTNGGKTLNVNFDGLTAGKKVIFNVDLDAEDMSLFPFPDYRNILFGAPQNGGTPTDPGSYAATFTNIGSPAPNTSSLGGDFDPMTTPPMWQNEDIRPYVEMDKVEIIVVDEIIPEPSSAVLALVGLSAFAAVRRRLNAA